MIVYSLYYGASHDVYRGYTTLLERERHQQQQHIEIDIRSDCARTLEAECMTVLTK
jgi:hypothetical protein